MNERRNTPYKPLLKRVADTEKSTVRKYQDLFIGSRSPLDLVLFEIVTSALQAFPGALGIFLRSRIYPILFKRCGDNVLFGRNVTLRVPQRIELGNHALIDDNAVLDAKGNPDSSFIRCGNETEISRNAILACKGAGSITLGNFVSIGRNALLSARAPIQIGDNCSIGPYACVLASGHDWSDPDTPVLLQDRDVEEIVIEENVWVGAHVTILDGVHIGKGSVIGVGSVVTHDVPSYRIAAGSPARVVRVRKESESEP
jgi:acetyltransferase-like isoleucine patch superfamily enzyme